MRRNRAAALTIVIVMAAAPCVWAVSGRGQPDPRADKQKPGVEGPAGFIIDAAAAIATRELAGKIGTESAKCFAKEIPKYWPQMAPCNYGEWIKFAWVMQAIAAGFKYHDVDKAFNIAGYAMGDEFMNNVILLDKITRTVGTVCDEPWEGVYGKACALKGCMKFWAREFYDWQNDMFWKIKDVYSMAESSWVNLKSLDSAGAASGASINAQREWLKLLSDGSDDPKKIREAFLRTTEQMDESGTWEAGELLTLDDYSDQLAMASTHVQQLQEALLRLYTASIVSKYNDAENQKTAEKIREEFRALNPVNRGAFNATGGHTKDQKVMDIVALQLDRSRNVLDAQKEILLSLSQIEETERAMALDVGGAMYKKLPATMLAMDQEATDEEGESASLYIGLDAE